MQCNTGNFIRKDKWESVSQIPWKSAVSWCIPVASHLRLYISLDEQHAGRIIRKVIRAWRSVLECMESSMMRGLHDMASRKQLNWP